MSEKQRERPFRGIDTSRRSVLQKGALATGALALGGSALGGVTADQHDDEEDDDNGASADEDHVLVLYPDAVENARATVVSDEIDWSPWEDETASDDVGTDEDDDEDDDDATDTEAGEQNYRAHLARFEFSASHVVPVFVPEDAELEVDDDVNFGEIEEFVHGPDEPFEGAMGAADAAEDTDTTDTDDNETETDDAGTEGAMAMPQGDPVLARISLEEEAATDGVGGDDDNGISDDEDDDNGISDDDEENATDDDEDDDGPGD